MPSINTFFQILVLQDFLKLISKVPIKVLFQTANNRYLQKIYYNDIELTSDLKERKRKS